MPKILIVLCIKIVHSTIMQKIEPHVLFRQNFHGFTFKISHIVDVAPFVEQWWHDLKLNLYFSAYQQGSIIIFAITNLHDMMIIVIDATGTRRSITVFQQQQQGTVFPFVSFYLLSVVPWYYSYDQFWIYCNYDLNLKPIRVFACK